MSGTVDEDLLWFAGFVCRPSWPKAARAVVQRTTAAGYELNLLRDGNLRDVSPEALSRVAEVVSEKDATVALAWRLLALRPTDKRDLIQFVVGDAVAMVSTADGDMMQPLARLRVWDALAVGKFAGDDIFKLADKYWRGELQYIVARMDERDRVASGVPACVELLGCDRWDAAFMELSKETQRQTAKLGIHPPSPSKDRKKQAAIISGFVNLLFAQGRAYTGELALAWQMMLCDPCKPASFHAVLPQVSWMLEHRAIITNDAEKELLRARLDIWWQAADGQWSASEVSVFRIAGKEVDQDKFYARHRARLEEAEPEVHLDADDALLAMAPTVNAVVVMRKDRAEERGLPSNWKDLRDQALPLVVCDDAERVRKTLRAEYPHAWEAIGLLTQDLRSGEPVRIKNTILLSPPGFGKSRMVRRLSDLISDRMYVYRVDAAGTHDGMYAGTSKGWSTAHPSAPARAIMMSKIANPIVFVDEVCKAGESTHNGNLWHSMTAFLEVETSRRYRESGIDAELDLSHVVHLATANSIERLPSQLRDRYRVIRIPQPTLAHLPTLAARVVDELATEDASHMAHVVQPFAPDELAIMGSAWAKMKFSMRALQKIVAATIEARDANAMRH